MANCPAGGSCQAAGSSQLQEGAPTRHWNQVFVYGTLKRGYTNYTRYLLPAEKAGKAVFAGAATTAERMPMALRPANMLPHTGAPVLLHSPGDGEHVVGEVFDVDDDTLEALDLLEGVKSGIYKRLTIPVRVRTDRGGGRLVSPEPSSRVTLCEAYFFPPLPELMNLPRIAVYGNAEHDLYRPISVGPIPEILALCTRPFQHGLASAVSSEMHVHCLRLLPGEDLLMGLTAFCEANQIAAAVVLTCVGSTGTTTLRPAGQPTPKVFEGKFEIVSLTGTVGGKSHHLHMSVSDEECRVLGGHLLIGSVVRTTAEVALGVLPGLRFTRPRDERTGYDELCIGTKRPRVLGPQS